MKTRGLMSLLVVVAAGATAAGCSSSADDLKPAGQTALRPIVVEVRQAAASGDQDTLQAAIRRLQRAVQHEENIGNVSQSRGSDIDDAATQLLNAFESTASSSPATPTTASPTTTSPAPTQSTTTPTPPVTTTTPPPPTKTVTVAPPTPPTPGGPSGGPGGGDGGDD